MVEWNVAFLTEITEVLMIKPNTALTKILPALILLFIYPVTGYAITIKKEEEIAKQFILQIKQHYKIIDDPEVSNYISKIGKEVLSFFPEQPFNYRFYVVKNDTFNAFAGPGGHIFMHSGLFASLENEDELAGILGHEIAHVACRHISDRLDMESKIKLSTIAGIAAGIFMSIYGDPAAGTALTVGSLAGGPAVSLAYSREDELQADRIGLQYLNDAGYSAKGLTRALAVIRSQQWFGEKQIPVYMMTHPAVEDRMSYIQNWVSNNEKGNKFKSGNSFDFTLARTVIKAKYTNPAHAKKEFYKAVQADPESLVANYGYGISLARTGKKAEAVTYLKKALEKRAFHTGILTTLGEVYFATGDYPKAESVFSGILSMEPDNFNASLYYSRSLAETGQLDKAIDAIKIYTIESTGNIKAFYCLADIYSRKKNLVDSAYYLGLYYRGIGDIENAKNQFQMALSRAEDPVKKEKIKTHLDSLTKKKKEKPEQKKTTPEPTE